MAKKIVLADIASSLGVSKTLVSLVVNNKGDAHGISKETQRNVREKIRELNYQPNELARGFRMGKSNTIGLIVSDISNRFYAKIARHIEDRAWRYGYTVIICSTDEKVEKEKEQIRLLMDRKVDGLIISSSQENPDYFNNLVDVGMPHVLIDRTFEQMKSPAVSVDNYGGAQLAAKHLLSQGITQMALVTITPEHISTISNRIDGFIHELKANGLSLPPEWFIKVPFDNIEAVVRKQLTDLKNTNKLPEAIFTLNNNLTTVCLKSLRELSVSVPKQIALVGFDDVTYFSFTQPSVTAIVQPIELISEKAFELLFKQFGKDQSPAKQKNAVLAVDIKVRESSLKPIPTFV